MPEFTRWFDQLAPRDKRRIDQGVRALEEHGPALSGQLAKRVRMSSHHNMKELRSVGGNLRVLFAFDTERTGVLLAGGDKTNNWDGWYRTNVPIADRILDRHLHEIGKGAECRKPRTGARSAGRSR